MFARTRQIDPGDFCFGYMHSIWYFACRSQDHCKMCDASSSTVFNCPFLPLQFWIEMVREVGVLRYSRTLKWKEDFRQKKSVVMWTTHLKVALVCCSFLVACTLVLWILIYICLGSIRQKAGFVCLFVFLRTRSGFFSVVCHTGMQSSILVINGSGRGITKSCKKTKTTPPGCWCQLLAVPVCKSGCINLYIFCCGHRRCGQPVNDDDECVEKQDECVSSQLFYFLQVQIESNMLIKTDNYHKRAN